MHVMSVGITNIGMIMMTDVIDRKAAIDAVYERIKQIGYENNPLVLSIRQAIRDLPSAQPERLTDDDFETIRIHLNAYKEKLCNQQRWEEADEYQRILDRFMSFASAQPDVPDTNVGDTISRQAAIDAVEESRRLNHHQDGKEACAHEYEHRHFLKLLRDLPSAQPDLSEYSDKLWKAAYERGKEEAQDEPHWIPCSERLPSKEERKEWIDKNLGGIGYLYPCLVTRYSSINPDRTKNNPYVAKHYYDGEDFVNNGEEVCSEYIVAWMPLPEPYREDEGCTI